MENQFKNKTYYKNIVTIFSPNGIIKEGTIAISEKWKKIMIYEIGNCGIDSMFKIVDKNGKELKNVKTKKKSLLIPLITKTADYVFGCNRCEITSINLDGRMCPCPRGGCEAEIIGEKIMTTQIKEIPQTKLNKLNKEF